jgi:hypothetical protein
VSDALDRLISPGADLLGRVDAVLTAHGLPADHPATELLRRLGALPSDLLEAVSTWRSDPLRDTAADLHRTAEAYEQQRDQLGTPTGWEGAAGAGFEAHRQSVVRFLGETGDPDETSLLGRLRATAAYLEDVAEWLDRSRSAMARAVADALGSAEAVRLHTSGDAVAAATLAARILTAAAEVDSSGSAVVQRWAGRLDEVPYRPPASVASSTSEARLTL